MCRVCAVMDDEVLWWSRGQRIGGVTNDEWRLVLRAVGREVWRYRPGRSVWAAQCVVCREVVASEEGSQKVAALALLSHCRAKHSSPGICPPGRRRLVASEISNSGG